MLGHVFEERGVRGDPGKVEAIQAILSPVNVTQVCSFLELEGCCKVLIKKVFRRECDRLTLLDLNQEEASVSRIRRRVISRAKGGAKLPAYYIIC